MDNILEINPADFGLPPTPQVDNSSVVRANSAVPSAALQNSIDYNPDLFSAAYRTEASKAPAMANVTQSYDKALFEKYEGTAAYSPWMNPYADNEKVAAENWTKWDAVTTGLSGLLDNAKLGGSEYLKGWARAGRALITLDASYLAPNETERQILAARQQQVRADNPIYYSPGTDDDIFSRQFLSETLQNTGFTFGTMAGFLGEMAVGAGIGKLALKLPSLFKIGAAANSVRLAESTGAVNLGKNLAKEKALVEAAQETIENGAMGKLGGKSLYDKALDVASNLPIIGSLAEAGKILGAEQAARAATGTIALTSQEIAKIGVGGLRRAFAEWNFAASETAIEAGGAYGEIYDDLYNKYVNDSTNEGKAPDPGKIQEFRNLAMQGSTSSYGTNLAVLAVMNKIAFGNIFRKFGVDNKYLNLLDDQSNRFFTVIGKKEGAGLLGKTYQKGYFGALGHAKDIKKMFGSKVLAREVGRDFVRGVGRIQLAEGLQENIQEGNNAFLKRYYGDIYDHNVASWGDSFAEAVDSQLSKQGFKTFLSGAITGLFVSPVTGMVGSVSDRFQGDKAHKQALKATLNSMNAFMMDPSNVLKEPIKNIKEQVILNRGLAESAVAGQKYEYFNRQSSSLIQQALYAKRTGTFDAFKEYLNAYGAEFDTKEFEEATGINVAEFGASTPAEFINPIVAKLDRYSELYDKYNSMYKQFFSIETVSDDSYAKQKLSVAQGALQDAIHTVAFNEAKAEDATVRSASIAQTIASKNKSIGQAAASTFNTIADHNLGELQVNILKNEIQTLEEGIGAKTPETLRLVELKKQELEALETWTLEAYEEIENPSVKGEKINVPLNTTALTVDKQNRLAQILTTYYTAKNRQNNINDPILQSEIKNVIGDINDYQRLSRDVRDYIDAVNLLSDPENGLKHVQSLQDARVSAFARLTHNQYQDLATQSGIFEKYIKDNPEEMNELLKMARSPFASIDSINKIYKHITAINLMVEDANKKIAEDNAAAVEAFEKAKQEADRILFNTLAAAPANIAAMDEADIIDFLVERFNINENNETDELVEIERVYKNYDGVEIITHTITRENLIEYFGEGFDPDNASKEQLIQFLSNFEQRLYEKANPTANPNPQASHKKEIIIQQTRKLKNLVEQEVLFEGKKGILTITDRGYVIEFEDDTSSILDAETPVEQQFTWVRNVATGSYNLVDQSNALTLDMFAGLELLDTELTEKEKQITGVNAQSEVVRERVVEYVDESTIKIDGLDYIIIRDESDNISELQHLDPSNTIILSYKTAALDPYGIASQYLTLVKTFMDIQNVPAAELEGDVLEEGIQAAESLVDQNDIVASTSGVQLREAVVAGQQALEIEVENIVDKNVPQDILIIFERFITPKTKKSVTQEERKKLFDWAADAVLKLHNLDPAHRSNSVRDSIDFLSKKVLNPIAKKDGIEGRNKPPRRPRAKKVKTAATARKTRTKKGEPSTPKNDGGKTIEEAEKHVNKVYDKMERETAVKIDELLQGQEPNKFIDTPIEQAIEFSKYNPSAAMDAATKPELNNPFEDGDILSSINCNI